MNEEKNKPLRFQYTLDDYEQEFFALACRYAGLEPTPENVVRLAWFAAKQGMNQAMQQVFEQYKAEKREI